MADSEVGGVPGGLVMVVGKRPGETRNNLKGGPTWQWHYYAGI